MHLGKVLWGAGALGLEFSLRLAATPAKLQHNFPVLVANLRRLVGIRGLIKSMVHDHPLEASAARTAGVIGAAVAEGCALLLWFW